MHPATEPTMTLEEYLKGRAPSAKLEQSTDFDSLTKKLQNAQRIIPADIPVSSQPDTEESTSSIQAIVSPTMAEIYASQQKFDAAIVAYEVLRTRQPEQSATFTRRIEELREQQRKAKI